MSVIINGTSGISTDGGSELFGSGSIGGSLTLTSGTANGVTYLNGSKVLTSGGALTYNGTSFGVGSSSYGDAGTISLSVGVAGSTTGGLQLWGTTTTEHSIQWGDGTSGSDTYRGAISYSHASDFMRFWTSSTEKMRLTSTGLGIGTSSPSANLDIVAPTGTAKIKVGNNTLAGGSYLNLQGASGSKTWFVASNYNIGGALEFIQSTANGGSTPAGTASMLIDSSGGYWDDFAFRETPS
jgi:hypothetical protein